MVATLFFLFPFPFLFLHEKLIERGKIGFASLLLLSLLSVRAGQEKGFPLLSEVENPFFLFPPSSSLSKIDHEGNGIR